MTDELKPCPFCSKPAKRYFVNMIGCIDAVNCGGAVEIGDHGKRTEAYAVESWNRRAGEGDE